MIVLNLGAGKRAVPEGLAKEGDTVISVDIDGTADVTADVRELPFEDDYADAAYASHLLEHFAEYEVLLVLKEWRRVLKPGGRLIIEVPDIQSAAQMIGINGIDSVLYTAVNGEPIRGQDVMFGWQKVIAEGNEPMRHKCAFDSAKLAHALESAGFAGGRVLRRPELFTLLAETFK